MAQKDNIICEKNSLSAFGYQSNLKVFFPEWFLHNLLSFNQVSQFENTILQLGKIINVKIYYCCYLKHVPIHSVSADRVMHIRWKSLWHTMRLLIQNLSYFVMQPVTIYQIIRNMKLLEPLTFPSFASFLQFSSS